MAHTIFAVTRGHPPGLHAHVIECARTEQAADVSGCRLGIELGGDDTTTLADTGLNAPRPRQPDPVQLIYRSWQFLISCFLGQNKWFGSKRSPTTSRDLAVPDTPAQTRWHELILVGETGNRTVLLQGDALRVDLRHGPVADEGHQGRRQLGSRPRQGLQADRIRLGPLARGQHTPSRGAGAGHARFERGHLVERPEEAAA